MPELKPSRDPHSLAGQILVAMPFMNDPRFEKAVIIMCVHNAEGAMGVVLNRQSNSITYPELLQQLGLPHHLIDDKKPVFYGGPVEAGRGFVVHSDDIMQESSVQITDGLALTATVDILRTIGEARGPQQNLLALGYAGWGPGQLEAEIAANSWLNLPADNQLIFDENADNKWARAMAKMGIALHHLSGTAGHA